MCILWLIGLSALGVAFLPFIGLIFGVNAAIQAVQKQKNHEVKAKDQAESEAEFNRPLAIRVAAIALSMLGVFLSGLLIRYWMT